MREPAFADEAAHIKLHLVAQLRIGQVLWTKGTHYRVLCSRCRVSVIRHCFYDHCIAVPTLVRSKLSNCHQARF